MSSALEVTHNGTPENIVITAPGLSDNETGQEFKDFRFKFRVDPYPKLGTQIEKKDYRLVMTVTRL